MMVKVIYKDSHTNANGCSIVEYQFDSVEELIKWESYKQQSLIDSLKGVGLFACDTEDFDSEPSLESAVVDINVAKKPKKGDLH